MLKCVCMIAEEWLIFGVSHLVPTSVALLEEEEGSFLWRSQQHRHLVLMRDPYLQERRKDYSLKTTKSEQLANSFWMLITHSFKQLSHSHSANELTEITHVQINRHKFENVRADLETEITSHIPLCSVGQIRED